VPVEVLETPLATAQASGLRGPAARAYERFLDDLAHRGCEALGYRVTGPTPLDRLCVKHLRGADRVVVAFETDTRAWVLLVGAHRDDDPGRDLYNQLYRLAGAQPRSDERRRKPPCCDDNDQRPPTLDEEAIAELVDRARALLRARQPRSRTRTPGRRRTRRS
jgi:hypothetical protein